MSELEPSSFLQTRCNSFYSLLGNINVDPVKSMILVRNTCTGGLWSEIERYIIYCQEVQRYITSLCLLLEVDGKVEVITWIVSLAHMIHWRVDELDFLWNRLLSGLYHCRKSAEHHATFRTCSLKTSTPNEMLRISIPCFHCRYYHYSPGSVCSSIIWNIGTGTAYYHT